MADKPLRGGRGTRGGFRGGRGGASTRGGRGVSRGGFESSKQTRGGFRGSGRGHAGTHHDDRKKKREEQYKSSAEKFIKSGQATRDVERIARLKEQREQAKTKARASRIDPLVESIMVGTKQIWNESREEGNTCKLSTKFFPTEKIKRIKISIDTIFKTKTLRYRTHIHFDDITHIKIAEDLTMMMIETRIPTLFEIGLPTTDADGVITIDWQEGRSIDWQQSSKNPHPNRYTFAWKNGAFKQEHVASLMESDSRLKSLIQKENPHLAEVSRGSKRSRDEVLPSPKSKSKEDGQQKRKGEFSINEADDSLDSKPAHKKKKLSEVESVPLKSNGTEKKEKKDEKQKKEKKQKSGEIDAKAEKSSKHAENAMNVDQTPGDEEKQKISKPKPSESAKAPKSEKSIKAASSEKMERKHSKRTSHGK